jgi:hypothetical protein
MESVGKSAAGKLTIIRCHAAVAQRSVDECGELADLHELAPAARQE